MASRIGCLVGEFARGDGAVLGVFSRSAGFRFGDYAVAVGDGAVESPFGICVDAIPFDLLNRHLGASVRIRNGGLDVAGGVWKVDISRAVVWPEQSVLWSGTGDDAGSALCNPELLESRLKEIGVLILSEKRGVGFSRLLGESESGVELVCSASPGIIAAAVDPIRRFEQGVWARDEMRCREAVEKLLGLGPGLTPSGDDFLAGLLLVLRAAGLKGHCGEFLERLWNVLGAIPPGKTNPFGWSLFRSALAGCSAGVAATAIRRLFLGHDPGPDLRKLAGIGGSSGVDMLVGIAKGLSIVLGEASG